MATPSAESWDLTISYEEMQLLHDQLAGAMHGVTRDLEKFEYQDEAELADIITLREDLGMFRRRLVELVGRDLTEEIDREGS